MSKEVKRHRVSWPVPDQLGRSTVVSLELVPASDYEALLAEREALKALLISSREFVAVYVDSSFFGPNARKQLEAIDAALQGEQPCSQR